MLMPREISVDPGTQEAFIGGAQDVNLTLEYKPVSGATSPGVKITVTDSDGTSEWNVTSIPDGFHVKSDFASVVPGCTVTLETTECMARLRWCELVSC